MNLAHHSGDSGHCGGKGTVTHSMTAGPHGGSPHVATRPGSRKQHRKWDQAVALKPPPLHCDTPPPAHLHLLKGPQGSRTESPSIHQVNRHELVGSTSDSSWNKLEEEGN